ncbi:hypothetical protein ON010_g10122 [Phytophthora cinnamomi]|nr:hypothetical protein ON010_g10122 [Phytophthora cinnamomi]
MTELCTQKITTTQSSNSSATLAGLLRQLHGEQGTMVGYHATISDENLLNDVCILLEHLCYGPGETLVALPFARSHLGLGGKETDSKLSFTPETTQRKTLNPHTLHKLIHMFSSDAVGGSSCQSTSEHHPGTDDRNGSGSTTTIVPAPPTATEIAIVSSSVSPSVRLVLHINWTPTLFTSDGNPCLESDEEDTPEAEDGLDEISSSEKEEEEV